MEKLPDSFLIGKVLPYLLPLAALTSSLDVRRWGGGSRETSQRNPGHVKPLVLSPTWRIHLPIQALLVQDSPHAPAGSCPFPGSSQLHSAKVSFLLSFAEGSVSCCWHPYRPRSWSLRAGRDGSRFSGRTGLNVEAYLSKRSVSCSSSSPLAPFVAEKQKKKRKKQEGLVPTSHSAFSKASHSPRPGIIGLSPWDSWSSVGFLF